MKRRTFLTIPPLCLTSAALAQLTGCGYLRIDPWSPLIRSPYITSPEDEQAIVAKGRLGRTDDGRIRGLYVRGNAYERGYQHGYLLRQEVNDNLGFIYEKALDKFHFAELFDEVYERLRPFIPQDYIDEMHGLAHGSRMPLHIIHAMHVLPEIGEWGGKRHIKEVIKKMMSGELGTSCSNLSVNGGATADGRRYTVRILDWGLHRISKLHEYPLITVGVPDNGNAYANIGWVGFLGAVSGMSEQGITLGEMGYKDPPNETLAGTPMPFLLREVMTHANTLADVRNIIQSHPGTCSFVFMMTDGKSGDAEIYIRDRDRFVVFHPGEDLADGKEHFPAIKETLYGGHYQEIMTDVLTTRHGTITPELLMTELIPKMVMKSNFQNVIYDGGGLRFWVNNALNKDVSAATQPYTLFDLGKALTKFRSDAL